MPGHLFLAGVPCTGKSRLGAWLADPRRGYIHIDAEMDGGRDFDLVGIHDQWNSLIETGRAADFLKAVNRLPKLVVIDWGFPTRCLYVVTALQAEGVQAWWFQAERDQARAAFVARGGIDPRSFDTQMDDIQREWLLIALVFGENVIQGFHSDGSQRTPEEVWSEICGRENS